MSSRATTFLAADGAIRWSWDFGVGLGADDAAALLALLAALRTGGTLARAAIAAGRSYRAAWGLLRRCEAAFGAPLVQRARGRGMRLSDLGERLLQLDDDARATLAALHAPWTQRLQALLAPERTPLPERLRIAASHDIALADWIANGRNVRVDIRWQGSEEALAALARGECDVAGFHLPGTWTRAEAAAWLGRWLALRHYLFVPVMRRRHGLITAAGNPWAIASLADAARRGLRLVNRQRGSGTRGMIDQLLAANGLAAADMPGYSHEEFTHDAVAAAIAAGQADVGVGIAAAAVRYDLGFIPLGDDRYAFALRAGIGASPAVAEFVRRLDGATFGQRLQALAGYAREPGHLTALPWERFPFAGSPA
jgi:molybdate transport repressor ModE-like protein